MKVINFVVESEEFFDTDLEKSCPEVRILYNMINKIGKSVITQNSFQKIRNIVKDQVAIEISGKHNPSTITALNTIINATDTPYKSAAFHSIKEAVNTWIPYFIEEYSNFGDEDKNLIINAMKFNFLTSISDYLK